MQKSIFLSAVLPIVLFVGALIVYASASVVQPGNKGVQITFGKVNKNTLAEGLHFINPLSIVKQVSIRQATAEMKNASALSSDLQTVSFNIKVLYRIPDSSVVEILTRYAGDPFASLIVPRVQEALKEAAAALRAEDIARTRNKVKDDVLASVREKMNLERLKPEGAEPGVEKAKPTTERTRILEIVDLVIEDIKLSAELERAIEAKMVQEQEAERARFVKNQAEIEAETAEIRARGEARALEIRGNALKQNPQVLQMNLIEKWNGVSPLVVGGGTQGPSFILPLERN